MSADIDALAVAVQAQLNDAARPWAGQFTATVGKTPQYTIKELADLQVHILPFGMTFETKARAIDEVQMTLEISFQKKTEIRPASGPDEPNIDTGDELVLLAKQVIQFLRVRANRRPPTYTAAELHKSEIVALYDVSLLTAKRQFANQIRLTYRELVETE